MRANVQRLETSSGGHLRCFCVVHFDHFPPQETERKNDVDSRHDADDDHVKPIDREMISVYAVYENEIDYAMTYHFDFRCLEHAFLQELHKHADIDNKKEYIKDKRMTLDIEIVRMNHCLVDCFAFED